MPRGTGVGGGDRVAGRAAAAVAALSLAAFAYVTSESLPIGLLLPMSHSLQVPASWTGLLVTAYAGVVVVATVPLTRVTARLRRRRLLCWMLATFIVATLASTVASTFVAVLAARLVSALSQALFWALVVPTTAALVPVHARGRAMAAVFGGVSVANLAGVPGGTWLGQVAGWSTPFLALSGLGAVALVGFITLLPPGPPGPAQAQKAASPDRRRYRLLVAATGLGATGSFVAYTYLGPFLTEVTRLPADAMSSVLLFRGLAGVIGVAIGGLLADRRPRAAIAASMAGQTGALLGLTVLGHSLLGTAALVAVAGLSFSSLSTALASRVVQVAPVSVDMGAAVISTAVNIGIGAGALGGGFLLTALGPGSTVLVGGLFSLSALGFALVERAPSPSAGRRLLRARVTAEPECELARSASAAR